ncbi:MAG TPA: GxxExxY protein [Anaerolineae bacterium]|nr:GxxExxY protein [Anaerolineae bacterium]HQH37260.1 GxxExxY protein [Anaerolineae bacterium]
MEFEGKHADVTDKIIGSYHTVYNTLGPGFAEKVYENALAFELRKSGYRVETQKPIEVY